MSQNENQIMKTTKVLATLALFALLAIHQTHSAPNYVLSLRNDTDHVSIPDSNALDLIFNLTLEAWVNLADPKGGTIIAKRNGGTGFALRAGGGKAVLGMNNGFGDARVINFVLAPPSGIVANTWYHVAATYDGTIAKVYVNGDLKDSSRVVMRLGASTFPVTIGREDLPGDPRPFLGLIDEVRVWNRALSQAEIQTYRSLRLTGREPGLVGYWNFDTGSAIDKTASGNDGQIMGQAKLIEGFMLLQKSPTPALFAGSWFPSGYRFDLDGVIDVSYQIETSTDFQEWIPLINVKLPAESLQLTDVTATNYPNQRFYRARRRP